MRPEVELSNVKRNSLGLTLRLYTLAVARRDIARTEQITWAEMAMLRLLTNWARARRMPSYGNPRGGEEDTDLCAQR